VLRIFARQRDGVGEQFDTALDYAVQARSGGGSRVGFPEVYDSFLVRECRLERPLTRGIPSGQKVRFAVSVPKAEEVVVVRSDEVWWVLDKRGELFSGRGVVGARQAGRVVFGAGADGGGAGNRVREVLREVAV